MALVLLLGAVSLFSDATYEGARSIVGPFLAVLGASGTIVGIVAGFGELIGYGLRLLSGIVADRTQRYWAITIAGYVINLLAVPMLALAGRWETAAALMIAERVGKAVRSPARDVMLSHATAQMGRGWGFGIHEAMDQAGAVTGPLIVAAAMHARGDYRAAFAILLIPALVALALLALSRFLYPEPRDLEPAAAEAQSRGFGRGLWWYVAGVALVAAAYVDFPLIAYHFEKRGVVPDSWIPIFYAIAMGTDAFAALILGRLYDRWGLSVVAGASAISLLFVPFTFFGGFALACAGMAVWGVGMGAQESIMRAAVAGMIPTERRGSAYGLINAAYGIAWFLGSALFGLLYDISIPALVVCSVALQAAAIPIFLRVKGIVAGP